MFKKKLFIYFSILLILGLFLIALTNTIYYQKEDLKHEELVKDINTIITDSNSEEEKELESLIKINKDTKGIIEIAGSKIKYPFVQTSNNSYYLNHSFDNIYNVNGWVFMDYRNTLLKNKNTIIYAHGISKKALFGPLIDLYESSDWLKDDSMHYVYIKTKDLNLSFKVFSFYRIETTNDYIDIDFKNNEDYSDFLSMIIKRSKYNFHEEVNINDKIITLSTCYNKKEKLVLHAKLIE